MKRTFPVVLVSLFCLIACGSTPVRKTSKELMIDRMVAEFVACDEAGRDKCTIQNGEYVVAPGYVFLDTNCDDAREVVSMERYLSFYAALNEAWNQPVGWTPPPSDTPSCIPINNY